MKQTIPGEFLRNKNDQNRWDGYKFYITKAIINGKITVCYDTHDVNWIDEEILRQADFYFKRGYDENYVSQLKDKGKVFPLGLNYHVSSSERDTFQIERTAFYGGKDKLKALIKALHKGKRGETEQLANLESLPNLTQPPKVLFTAQVWDPNLIENKTQKEAVERLNETRAECVRRLRKEFGKDFLAV